MAGLHFSIAGLAALAATFFLLFTQVAAQCSGVTSRFRPKMGTGYTVQALATGLRTPRGIAIDSAGNLLVAEQQGGSVRRLVLKDSGNSVCVDSSSVIATGTNHGIDLTADGKMLIVSSVNQVTAYDYDAATGKTGTGKVIITGLQAGGTVHPTRTVLTSKVNPDFLIVARGSNSNIDTATTSTSAARSIIKVFSISKLLASPTAYTTGGEVLGWGLRNIVGMGEDPFGGIWSVENSMDDIRLNSKDVHNENPAEKLNYHGALNDTNNKLKGANFGYPSCVAAWDPSSLGGSLKVGDLFKPDGTPAGGDCASKQQGRIMFHSHTAPLDVKFTPDGNTAYISFHGSWDRSPPDGYRVMKVEFKNGQPVQPVTSKTASIPVMENQSTGSCPSSCFRPVGLAFDSKKRLYMSSDTSGEIYVIYGA